MKIKDITVVTRNGRLSIFVNDELIDSVIYEIKFNSDVYKDVFHLTFCLLKFHGYFDRKVEFRRWCKKHSSKIHFIYRTICKSSHKPVLIDLQKVVEAIKFKTGDLVYM